MENTIPQLQLQEVSFLISDEEHQSISDASESINDDGQESIVSIIINDGKESSNHEWE